MGLPRTAAGAKKIETILSHFEYPAEIFFSKQNQPMISQDLLQVGGRKIAKGDKCRWNSMQ